MNPKKVFEEIITICYEEDGFEELHQEVLSIENGIRDEEDSSEYTKAIGLVLEAIYTFAPDFNQENYYHIEEIYGELLEQI